MPTTKRTALVAGASGLAGGYMLAHLLEQGAGISLRCRAAGRGSR